MSFRLPVVEGGTGAGALAPGYVRANGASAFTSVPSIPWADIVVASASIPVAKLSFSATDKIAGRASAGAGAGEEITCTGFARTLLDDADAAAARATLGANDAGNLTAGTVGTARLGTGTANDTAVLIGNQTWANLINGVWRSAAAMKPGDIGGIKLRQTAVAAAAATTSTNSVVGLIFARDQTVGGWALIGHDGGATTPLTIIASSPTAVWSLVDGGGGSNQWYISTAANVISFKNNYGVSHTIQLAFLSVEGEPV